MRRVVFLWAVVAFFCFWNTLAVGQTVKVFKKQGTLGHIAVGCGKPVTDWNEIRTYNLNLPSPVQIRPGVWDVRVFEGDSIFVPDDWDCSKLNPTLAVVTSRPLTVEERKELFSGKKTAGDEKRDSRSLWFLLSLGEWTVPLLSLLLAIGIVLFLYWVIPTIYWWLIRRNPARYPSMIPGGLSNDPEMAVRQVETAYPGRIGQTARVERGHFVRDSGPKQVLAGMTFRDGFNREVYIRPGDAMYRFTFVNGKAEYYRQACGNLSARFNPPTGWRFVGETHDIPQPAVAPEKPIPTEQPAVPVETSVPTAPAVSQNHQGFTTIRIFDDSGKIMMEIDGENPSIQVERGPQGTKVSRRS